jgi:hypothetical protein
MLYNIFVSFLYYYLAAYYLNSIFKRNVIGGAPAFRKHQRPALAPKAAAAMLLIVPLLEVPLYFGTPGIAGFISDSTHDIGTALHRDI